MKLLRHPKTWGALSSFRRNGLVKGLEMPSEMEYDEDFDQIGEDMRVARSRAGELDTDGGMVDTASSEPDTPSLSLSQKF
jgi:hypothetical protein